MDIALFSGMLEGKYQHCSKGVVTFAMQYLINFTSNLQHRRKQQNDNRKEIFRYINIDIFIDVNKCFCYRY